ncbi:MAG: hypothetical protein JWL98_1860, partial [Xanthomonadaceae bacterium]|nr:hypothetical protein [Xanthomonadaceae bacterium]
GNVAARKIVALLDAGADVTVGALEIGSLVSSLKQQGRIRHLEGEFAPDWFDGAWLAIAATNDPDVNRAVAAAGNACRVWVNVVDDSTHSSFHVPARVERGPLQIAISSGGGAPMLARHVRRQLETQFDESLGALAALLTAERRRIVARLPDVAVRRRFFENVLSGPVTELLRRDDPAAARDELLATLRLEAGRKSQGSVALVGAGPGDAGLLTLRALRVLNEADVILHDRLVSPDVLALARRDAHLIEVGKQAGRQRTTQDEIHALLLQHAQAGKRVVRLKGGDPFVFGRGGEELVFLHRHGIAFEVVPGITAALACGAYAGIPLTHRDHAHSIRFLTAHGKDSSEQPDWRSLVPDKQTIAVYMGVGQLGHFRNKLVAHGKSPKTPCALIENGSLSSQRVFVADLDSLVDLAIAQSVQSPALLIVGEVAALATQLHWFGAAPIVAAHRLAHAA